MTNFYVVLYDEDIDDGAYIEEVDEDNLGFGIYKYSECVSLAQHFEVPVEFKMDTDSPDWRVLFDLVWASGKLTVVSEDFKKLLENEDCGATEYLPITILDQRGKSVKDIYYILNTLESVDYIDEQSSEIEFSNIDTSKIDSIEKLVVDETKIPKGRQLFRSKKKGNRYVVTENLKNKIEKAGLEGILFVPTEEFDTIIYG